MSIWNERIKKRRLNLGITLAQIAKELGVTEATAQRYESGSIKNIPYDYIVQYSKILDVSPAYLMGWEDQYSVESADLHLKMTADKQFQELYFYWEQMSDIGKGKVIDNIQDLSKIYRK